MVKVKSEVAGSVWKLEVPTGASVERGDVLMILESMKMEITVEAPCAGICRLNVVEQQSVQEGDILALLDDESDAA